VTLTRKEAGRLAGLESGETRRRQMDLRLDREAVARIVERAEHLTPGQRIALRKAIG